jgi:uncharacterized protein (DUF2164 family)
MNDAVTGLAIDGEIRLGEQAKANIAEMQSAAQRVHDMEMDIDVYHARASRWQADLVAQGQKIADEMGVDFYNPGIKAIEDARAKMGRKGYKTPHKLTDVVRSGFGVQSAEQADALIARLGATMDVMDEGWSVTEHGYADRKVLVRFADGTIGEVQIAPKEMWTAKKVDGGHKLYKEWRNLSDDDPKAGEIAQRMSSIYQAASERLPSDFRASLTGAGKGGKSGNRSWKLASSSMTPAVYRTSLTSSAGSQSSPGSEMNQADFLSSNRQGLFSQRRKPTLFMGGSPNDNIGAFHSESNFSVPPPQAAPMHLVGAYKLVDSLPKGTPEQARMIESAKAEGLDPETGGHDLETDLDILRARGVITEAEEAALKAADETYDAATAWGDVAAQVLTCKVSGT